MKPQPFFFRYLSTFLLLSTICTDRQSMRSFILAQLMLLSWQILSMPRMISCYNRFQTSNVQSTILFWKAKRSQLKYYFYTTDWLEIAQTRIHIRKLWPNRFWKLNAAMCHSSSCARLLSLLLRRNHIRDGLTISTVQQVINSVTFHDDSY